MTTSSSHKVIVGVFVLLKKLFALIVKLQEKGKSPEVIGFFGNKCKDNVKNSVKAVLEVDNEVLNDTYLGMPNEIARAASSSFKFLPD
jgi:hypothetical protein